MNVYDVKVTLKRAPTINGAKNRFTCTKRYKLFTLILIASLCYLVSNRFLFKDEFKAFTRSTRVYYQPEILERCRALNLKPSPPPDFRNRKESDRFVPGTSPTLIKNATIWTGDDNGKAVVVGDVLIDKGLIRWIGKDSAWQDMKVMDVTIIDAKGAWLTPGIVDLHSHLAVESAPALRGAEDGNSLKGVAQPWLRSLDGLNTHDDGIALAVAGGVTSSLILPGSANAIGGQAFAIKLRPTNERSPTSMLLEPPYGLNGSEIDYNLVPRWRQMKHACGENPSRVYKQTRMDTAWNFRSTYNKAKQIKEQQDAFCEKALNGEWAGVDKFPEELQWEAVVDVLRGKVKVQTHCYEAVDLDNFVRLSNEFQFPVAAFHHAHETYLVPNVLKRAYGDVPPASAMFASFSRYKRESYRHSEFAPKILNDAGLRVVMKSDHNAIVSRYLLHEAQQAHYYGLPSNIAMRSVISTPAEVMGYDHRIGYIREGYDADIVLWDSHPLQLGATPIQVFIDGIDQLKLPYVIEKPSSLQSVPITPNFDKEAAETLKYEGLPPLGPQKILNDTPVLFTNVSRVWERTHTGISERSNFASENHGKGSVVAEKGEITCIGSFSTCSSFASNPDTVTIDLQGGAITPGLISFGTNLGLQEIGMEVSTTDGSVYDAFDKTPSILGGTDAVIRASDGLQFSTRDELLAYRAGVTSAITPPDGGFLSGLSVYFSTGASHRLEDGAVLQNVAALHFAIGPSGGKPSVSTQVSALRRLLLESKNGELGYWVKRVLNGDFPLVIETHSADIIATLLMLKKEVETATGKSLRMTLAGATEAHILAQEIGEAGVGVILNPVRPFPYTWDTRRILPGPPLSKESAIVHLLSHNVTVGLGVMGISLSNSISAWAARNARFDVSWAYLEAGGVISRTEALALASSNMERLLGIETHVTLNTDLVVTMGGDLLDIESKVVGIVSSRRKQVELFS